MRAVKHGSLARARLTVPSGDDAGGRAAGPKKKQQIINASQVSHNSLNELCLSIATMVRFMDELGFS